MWKMIFSLWELSGLFFLCSACLPDTNFIGIVLNNGERSDFQKIETMGKEGINFLKQGYFVLDTNMQLPVIPETMLVSSVKMVSEEFQYDPFSISKTEFCALLYCLGLSCNLTYAVYNYSSDCSDIDLFSETETRQCTATLTM
jgi:hypothetical protein